MATSGLNNSGASTGTNHDMWENKDLMDAWMKVQDRLLQLAKKERRKFDHTMSIAEVMECLETSQKKRGKLRENHEWIRNEFFKALTVFQTFSDIASSVASNVFAPSSMCFNAITIVIQGCQKYQAIHEILANLFKQCQDFFERLEEYRRAKMDDKLARLVCQFLDVFVAICEKALGMRSKLQRCKAAAAALFLGDDGMQDLLKAMQDLVSKELSLVVAQSSRIVHETNEKMTLLINDRDGKARDRIVSNWHQNLIRVLGFPDDMLISTVSEAGSMSEPRAEWARAFNQYKDNLTANTGSWIQDIPAFKSWAQDRHYDYPLLVLEGAPGTGKSYMMTSVHQHLLERNVRCSVAYIYLDSSFQKGSAQETFAYISRCLIWQCAASTEALMKSMSRLCDGHKILGGPMHWWSVLLLDNPEMKKLDRTFYLLIDGLNSEISSVIGLLRRLTTEYTTGNIRVCLAARPDTAQTLTHSKLCFKTVKVQQHNGQDIKNFIISMMDQIPILQDTDSLTVSKWRNKILETLIQQAGGDYHTLISSLGAISRTHHNAEIKKVLERAGKMTVDSQLGALNEELTDNEIEEINKIILLITHGRAWFNLDDMESMLNIQQRATPDLPSGSLIPLDRKLKSRYSLFQVTPGTGWVKFRYDGLESEIPDHKASESCKDHMSEHDTIQEAEIKIVEHFVKQVCHDDLYSRFDFDKFFMQKRNVKRNACIRQDSDNADLRIALDCLRILLRQRGIDTESLRSYALGNFLPHMENVNLVRADKELKVQMRPLLLRLFTEPSAFRSMLCMPDSMGTDIMRYIKLELPLLEASRRNWLWTTRGVKQLSRWLKDNTAFETVNSQAEADLLRRFMEPTSILESRSVLLRPAAMDTAFYLFSSPGYPTMSPEQARLATIFLHGYISVTHDPQNAIPSAGPPDEMGQSSGAYEPNQLTISEFEDVENWAFKALNISGKDSAWESRAATLVLMVCPVSDDLRQIIHQRLDNAVQLDSTNWVAWYFKAAWNFMDDAEMIDKLTEATQKMEQAAKNDPSWLDDANRKPLLADLYLLLGKKVWSTGKNLEVAAWNHLESLKYHRFQSLGGYSEVLVGYGEAQAWENVMNLMEKLTQDIHGSLQSSVHLLWQILDDRAVQETVAQAVGWTGRWSVIQPFFSDLMRRLEESGYHDSLFIARVAYADILNLGGSDGDKVIELWQKIVDDAQPGSYKYTDIISTERLHEVFIKLAAACMQRVTMAHSSPEKVKEYIIRVENLVQITQVSGRHVYTSCCLARLHLKIGQREQARKAVSRVVQSGLEMISDDDPSNDITAVWCLASIFASMNDVVQTIAMWHLLGFLQRRQRIIDQEITDAGLSDTGTRDTEIGAASHPNKDEEVARMVHLTPTGETGRVPPNDSTGKVNNESHEKTSVTLDLARQKRVHDGDFQPNAEQLEHSTESKGAGSSGSKVLAKANAQISGHYDPVKLSQIICAGCNCLWMGGNELYTCNDCVGMIQFCRNCRSLLSQGNFGFCGKEHMLTYVPPWGREASVMDKLDKVPVGNGLLRLEDWKEQVKSSYIMVD